MAKKAHKGPDQNPSEGVAEGNGHAAHSEEVLKIRKPRPGKQGAWRHMLLVVIRKRHQDQHQQRDHREKQNAQHRKG